MTKFNFFYNGTPITNQNFLANVPENWEDDLDEYGCYSYGYYSASEIDVA